MWEMLGSIAGIVSLIITIGGIIYVFGFKLGWLKAWKESVDNWMKSHDDNLKTYPPGETALMCKTMWDIYVVGALRDRPDLATHHSPFDLTPDAVELIPDDLKVSLNTIQITPRDREALATGYLVVRHLGLPSIEAFAQLKNIDTPLAIAILSTYLDNHTNNHHPV